MIESNIEFESKPVRYIPALGFKQLTPFFDPFLRWIAREKTFKIKLIKHAAIRNDFRVLDLGCGTATLSILVKKTHPSAEVIGIDIDPDILEISKRKAAKAGVHITFDLGTAFKLPYAGNYFDRVVSSLVFHHLTTENKILTLKEVLRVLKPNGELHVADFGNPQNFLMFLPTTIMRRFEESEDNFQGLLPRMFTEAGFDSVEQCCSTMTPFGTVILYKGLKPMI